MIMAIRYLTVLLVFVLIVTVNPSCKKYYAADSGDNELSDDSSGSEDENDYIWDNSKIIYMQLNGTSVSADDSSITISGSKVTITAAGTYSISGSLTNGQIIVNTKDKEIVRLILNSINITCSNSAPIYVKNAAKVLIALADKSDNYLIDGASYILDSDNEPNAAVFSKSYLSFYGNGSLTVMASYANGITSKDGLVIKSGTLNVNSADDGIRGKDYLILKRGNITITSKGDGLKSDNETDPSLGFISIDSAIVKITASGDGLDAQTNLKINDGSYTITSGGGAGTVKSGTGTNPPGGGSGGGYSGSVSEKALKAKGSLIIEKGNYIINSADDALHSNNTVTIDGGTFSIASGDDAIHAETSITINNGTLNISKCYEGIESYLITVNDGIVNLVSTDDGFNATKGLSAGGTEANDGSSLIINGGNITVNSTNGDGLDSNGNVVMTGGTVVVHGPASAPEVGFDVNGTFNISGGILLGTGPNSGNMIEATSTISTQYAVKATISSTLGASSLFHIQDSNGNDIVTYKPVRSIYYIVFSSPELKNGATYSIYTGGISSGTNTNGLFSGGIYSEGTLKKTFIVSGKVTNVSF
jgi:hypothetical protein